MNYLKSFYLFLIYWLPLSKKKQVTIVYLMSFSSNDGEVIKRLAEKYSTDFLLFFTENNRLYAEKLAEKGVTILPYSQKQLLVHNGISYLKQAQVVVADNYFPELAILKPNKNRRIIQLWHAIGAVKTFGWEDSATLNRSTSDQRRFQKVYDAFTDIVVSSEAMGQVFVNSWKAAPEVLRYLGFPKADLLVKQSIATQHGSSILYAPTYRENSAAMMAVIESAIQAFSQLSEQSFLLKLHPAVSIDKLVLPNNVALTKESLEQLFPQTEILVTDYSASLFEFMVNRTNGKVIFFVPDLEIYKAMPGIQKEFLDYAPGPVTKTTEELTEVLNKNEFSSFEERAVQWEEQWNQYNDGKAGKRVLALVDAGLGRIK
ncbi:CDP-glycerol glycerophosphotransferase family protein [Enterococcus sp. BWT-B8]|uniref:CDP-glycerol glycerophosphotransferase family protein n=1 Tax=Enterococcus sp. BWT-B8 TaxID=2885157 RepID=UPI001E4F2881|nr:CDP-glycerol glycerophosphotransferase family protein [Enterococcus sp. BWT-B8]MCB5952933.1 CDP-glycerol glycerophosphotransferase family protein [Enterococcus sp. BWT-B8]